MLGRLILSRFSFFHDFPFIKVQALYLIASNINLVLLTLFLWRQTSLATLITFKLYEVLLIPIAAVVAGFLVDRVSAKATFLFGLFLFLIEGFVLIVFQNDIANYIIPLAFLYGTSSAFIFLPIHVLNQSASRDSAVSYFSKLAIVNSMIAILFPIVGGLIIFLSGYRVIFFINAVVILIAFWLTLRLKTKTTRNPYTPLKLVTSFDKRKLSLSLIYFFRGVEFGFLTPVLPVITLMVLGNEASWGVFTTIISLIAVAFALKLGRYKTDKPVIGIVGILSFLIAATSLVFATNFNFVSFVLLILVMNLWQTAQRVGLRPMTNKIIEDDPNYEELRTEYHSFLEIPFSLGRAGILLILLIVGPALESISMLGFLFAILGILPLYEQQALALSGDYQILEEE